MEGNGEHHGPDFHFVKEGFDSVTEKGFSLVEVMIAMVILAFAVVGAMAMFRWSDHGLQQGAKGTRALALLEERLEAKRSGPWSALLTDDLDLDGTADIQMRDDGVQDDVQAGDNVYTAGTDIEGIHLVWTVQPDRSGHPHAAGSVVIKARAIYQVDNGQWRTIELGTLRSNPSYLGER